MTKLFIKKYFSFRPLSHPDSVIWEFSFPLGAIPIGIDKKEHRFLIVGLVPSNFPDDDADLPWQLRTMVLKVPNEPFWNEDLDVCLGEIDTPKYGTLKAFVERFWRKEQCL